MVEQPEKSASEINCFKKALSEKTGMIIDFVTTSLISKIFQVSNKKISFWNHSVHAFAPTTDPHKPGRDEQKTDQIKIDNKENTENIDRPIKSLVIGDSILKGVKKNITNPDIRVLYLCQRARI